MWVWAGQVLLCGPTGSGYVEVCGIQSQCFHLVKKLQMLVPGYFIFDETIFDKFCQLQFLIFISSIFQQFIIYNLLINLFMVGTWSLKLVFLRRMHFASRELLISYRDILPLPNLFSHIIIRTLEVMKVTGNFKFLCRPESSRRRRTSSEIPGRRCWRSLLPNILIVAALEIGMD